MLMGQFGTLVNKGFACGSDGLTKLPGFCDVHVHFREPGFSYKETILTGTKAAAGPWARATRK